MAGIIKATGRMEPRGKSAATAFHFDDMGQSYLGRVKAEAAQIVATARQEAATIKAKATEEGRQAAIEAAQASLRTRLDQQLTSIVAALRQAVEKIDHSRHTWQQHWEQHAVELARGDCDPALPPRVVARAANHSYLGARSAGNGRRQRRNRAATPSRRPRGPGGTQSKKSRRS